MFKKVIIALILLAVALAPVSSVSAKPKGPGILIEDIVYTVKDIPDFIAERIKGPVLYAEGMGTIDCNGVTACVEAGLHGQTVTIQQAFTGTSVAAAVATASAFKARAVGRLQLPGEYSPINFKGNGRKTVRRALRYAGRQNLRTCR